MTCPHCGTENADAARFCGECGTALSATIECADCGTANPVGQKFCNGCGHALNQDEVVAPAAAVEGERKQVTVMFIDVQSSMELAGSVDDETWRSLMDRFYSLVAECVNRFDGTVDKFTGDGAMVLFGAPVAHEDHAARACHTALFLGDRLDDFTRTVRRDHGLGLSVRMGLNSGEVVVGDIGADRHVAYTAIGNTVGLAARMEALAEPGKPLSDEEHRGAGRRVLRARRRGRAARQGRPGAGARVRADRRRQRAHAARRVRRPRVVALRRAGGRARSARGGVRALARGGQVVGVVADPGTGKSRLCREFTDRCRARGIAITEGRGVAHGRRIPLLPVVEMLRGYFGIGEDDDSRLAREKIAGRLLLLDEAFRQTLPVLFAFLGVEDPDHPAPQMGPEARERALFGAISRLVHARSDEGGGVILVEDLHWLDPGSEAFLAHLIESLPGTRTLRSSISGPSTARTG